MRKFTLSLLPVLTCALLFLGACTVLPDGGTPAPGGAAEEPQLPLPKTLTNAEEIALYNQVQAAAAGREDVVAFILFDVVIDHVDFDKDDLTALVWTALVDKDSGYIQPGEPGLVIARRASQEDPWKLIFQADSNYAEVLQSLPEKLISADLREKYMPAIQKGEKGASIFRGYKLPWAYGQRIRLTGSIGHVYTYKSCPADCLYAFDFANGTMFPIHASKAGTVKYAVWQNPNGNTTKANYIVLEDKTTDPVTYQVYLHLAQNTIPVELRQVGAKVMQGQFIGNVDDTGASTGHHLHFHVHTSTTSYWGRSVDIRFDEVAINDGRPRLCSETKAYPQFGSECVSDTYYVSKNRQADTVPPTGGISSPAAYATITSPTLNVSGWMDDDYIVESAQLLINTGGAWKELGVPITTTSFTTEISLCDNPRVPNGTFFLALKVTDSAGNVSADETALTELTKDYTCPALPPVCTPAETQAALYSETGFQGVCQLLEIGKYKNMSELGQVGPDQARSIMVGSGVSALLYTGAGFEGTAELFQDGDSDLADNPVGPDGVSSVKVVSRIQPPLPPELKLPEVITTGTDLALTWNVEESAETRASLSGPQGYTNALEWQTGGSWQIGALPEGEYSLMVETRNIAGSASNNQNFTVVAEVIPPLTHMEALPTISSTTAIKLAWLVDGGEENIDHFELQLQKGEAGWQDWGEPLPAPARELLFFGLPDKTYDFRIRAVGLTGVQEPYPDSAEASTIFSGGCSDDVFEGVEAGDDALSSAAAIEPPATQAHNWCPLGDVDWVSVTASQGDKFTFTTSPVGLASAALLRLYGADGTSLLGEAVPENNNAEARLQWTAPADGTVYLKLTPVDERVGGQETIYELNVERTGSVSPGVLVCGSVSIPAILGAAYAITKKVTRSKKKPGVGW